MFILIVLLSAVHAEDYTIQTKTSRCFSCRTNNIDLKVTLVGEDGREATTPHYLDNRHDNFRIGRTDTFTVSGLDSVGALQCVILTAEDSDAWRFDWVQVKSTSLPDYVKFNNHDRVWMSSDTGEGSASLRLCQDPCNEHLPISEDYWDLVDVDYDVDTGELHMSPPTVVGEQHIDNQEGSVSQSTSFSVRRTVTESRKYSHKAGVKVKAGTPFQSHKMPDIKVEGKDNSTIEIKDHEGDSVEVSYEFTYGNELTTRNTLAANYNCVAAPGATVTCKAVLLRGRIDVPYTQYWHHRNSDCVKESSGVYEQVAAVKLLLEIDQE